MQINSLCVGWNWKGWICLVSLFVLKSELKLYYIRKELMRVGNVE